MGLVFIWFAANEFFSFFRISLSSNWWPSTERLHTLTPADVRGMEIGGEEIGGDDLVVHLL